MVKGLEKFKEHFSGFENNYVIIGGTACDVTLQNTDMRPRVTDDIDMILVIEKMTHPMNTKWICILCTGRYFIIKTDYPINNLF